MSLEGHRRVQYALFVLALLWLVSTSLCHPNCVVPVDGNIFPPIPNPPLSYCSWYGNTSDGACCTATSEIDEAKLPAETVIDFADVDPQVRACAEYVKEIYCTWCNPLAGHNYEAENGQGHRAGPWLCTAYCSRLWQACANVPLNAAGPSTIGSSMRIPGLTAAMGTTTLAAQYASEAAYCSVYATGNPGSCYTDNPQELVTIPGGASVPIEVELAYPNLVFNSATIPLQDPSWTMHIVHVAVPPGTTRMFATFQHGVILSWNDSQTATSFNTVLDIQSSNYFDNGGGSEYGVMGVGFHPDFVQNGWMFVKHSHMNNRDRIVRFTVDVATWTADPASMLVILDYEMFGVMHHGAPPIFGADGMMYVANGDGVNYFQNGVPYSPAQDPLSLLGKMLRIDVSNSNQATPYTVPNDNPFVGDPTWAPEVWAYGFRNPWRTTYDALTDRFWTGSVGQTMYEGIWVMERGKFHGWHTREGYNCYYPTTSLIGAPFTDCATANEVLPLFEFPHDQSYCAIESIPAHCQFPAISGNAVIGGYVYRGKKNPSLYGSYIFANYQPNFEAWVYTLGFDPQNPSNVRYVWRLGFIFPPSHDPGNWAISTLGVDHENEILVININNPNEILRFKPDSAMPQSPLVSPPPTPATVPSVPVPQSAPMGQEPPVSSPAPVGPTPSIPSPMTPTSAPTSQPSPTPTSTPQTPISTSTPASDASPSVIRPWFAIGLLVASHFSFFA